MKYVPVLLMSVGVLSSMVLQAAVIPNEPLPRNASIEFDTPKDNGFNYFSATFEVPNEVPIKGVAFIWPGLGPSGKNYLPIDNGVLQPVLTYNVTAVSCAPYQQEDLPQNYQGWWISGQYVNTYGHQAGFTGCNGGHVMAVHPGDTLKTELIFDKELGWIQTISDVTLAQQVSYIIKLEGIVGQPQEQNRAYLDFESAGGSSLENPITFKDITLKTLGSNTLVGQSINQCSTLESRDINTVHIDECHVKAG